MEWIKKHITLLVVIIIVFALVLPICINALYLVNTDCEILHKPSEWTTFWGSYLGAIISAGVAFIILHIQRKDNEKDNNDNRENNKTQNEANRQLQLNIMRYQQEIHWLDNFRSASLEYCHAFNNNDVVLVTNLMWENPKDAFKILKTLYDKLGASEAHFSFLCKNDDKGSILKSDVFKTHLLHQQLLDDIQWVVLYFTQESPLSRNEVGFANFLKFKNYKLTITMTDIMQRIRTNNNWGDFFYKIYNTRVQEGRLYESDVKNRMYKYIKEEQERINNILTTDLN
jgi:hypothetical protein